MTGPASPGRLLCGYQEAEGQPVCRNTAPCVVHRDLSPAAAAADPVTGLYEKVTDKQLPAYAVMKTRVMGGPAALPAADLREQLRDDDRPWSVRHRLTKSLRRPALATRLADALPPLLGAELADRVDTIVTQAVTETEAVITQQLSDAYHQARRRLDADAAKKLQEVHDERFRNPSRPS